MQIPDSESDQEPFMLSSHNSVLRSKAFKADFQSQYLVECYTLGSLT